MVKHTTPSIYIDMRIYNPHGILVVCGIHRYEMCGTVYGTRRYDIEHRLYNPWHHSDSRGTPIVVRLRKLSECEFGGY